MALSCLIARSRVGTYTVRSGTDKGKHFNVADPAVRKAAYPDLFADELDALQNDRWQAQSTTTIDPTLAAADKFDAVRAVERVATGDTAQTDELGRRAAVEARQIIDGYIRDRNKDLADIATDAKVVVVPARPAYNTGHVFHPAVKEQLRGMTARERKLVASVSEQTGRIDKAIAEMNSGFGVPAAFTDLHPPATDLNRLANRLLTKYPG